jgi:hypothetical protein
MLVRLMLGSEILLAEALSTLRLPAGDDHLEESLRA